MRRYSIHLKQNLTRVFHSLEATSDLNMMTLQTIAAVKMLNK